MELETVQEDMVYFSSSKSLYLQCSEPKGKHTFGHKEVYFNEYGLFINVNSYHQQLPAINHNKTLCIIYTECKQKPLKIILLLFILGIWRLRFIPKLGNT